MDKDFVAATIQAIGRCATNIGRVRDTCLNGLVQLLSNRDGQCVSEWPALMSSGRRPVCPDTMHVHLSVPQPHLASECCYAFGGHWRSAGSCGGDPGVRGPCRCVCPPACGCLTTLGPTHSCPGAQSLWWQSLWWSLRSCSRCSLHSTERSSNIWQSSQITSR